MSAKEAELTVGCGTGGTLARPPRDAAPSTRLAGATAGRDPGVLSPRAAVVAGSQRCRRPPSGQRATLRVEVRGSGAHRQAAATHPHAAGHARPALRVGDPYLPQATLQTAEPAPSATQLPLLPPLNFPS